MGGIVFFTVCTFLAMAVTIFSVYESWPLLSAVSGLLLGMFSLCLFSFTVVEDDIYNYAIIELPDKTVVEGDLDDYNYSNDRVKVTIDGIPYEVDSDNCVLFVK